MTATAHLRVEVQPSGAIVRIDGLRSGTTPVSLELPAGQYALRVELEGYQPLERRIVLAPGDEAAVAGQLTTLGGTSTTTSTPTATSTATPTPELPDHRDLPDLRVRSARIELATGGRCDYTSTQLGLSITVENAGTGTAGPFAVEANNLVQTVDAGLAAGEAVRLWFPEYVHMGENTVQIDPESEVVESDEDNNLFSQMLPVPTLPPTCTPPVTPSPTPSRTPLPPPAVAVTIKEGKITLPTYPYASFVSEGWNETFNMAYQILDREAYEASDPVPTDNTYRTLEVENEYLRLVFLPGLGGRLYEVIYKPTGHRETYRNPVLKPSPWGPPEQGWWLAAGGIEWCLPVEEHGYEWGVPWKVTATQDGQSVTVTLRDTEPDATDRVRAVVVVRLEAGASSFTIRTRLENPTNAPLAVKYWTNAMLAPGGQNAPTAELRLVLPDSLTAVTVHSRGDDWLPGYGERISWPVVDAGPTSSSGGVDLSRLGNWNRWLGFFENPAVGAAANSAESFMAVYDEGYDEGMVRVFPADQAPGAKVFAFGWKEAVSASNWTDDGSAYVEIHGGPAPTFEDSVTLPANGQLQWTETWYPVAGLGSLHYANTAAALHLAAEAGGAQVAVAMTRAWTGDLVLHLDGEEIWRQKATLLPGQPFRGEIPLGDNAPPQGRLTLRLEGAGGDSIAEYGAEFDLK